MLSAAKKAVGPARELRVEIDQKNGDIKAFAKLIVSDKVISQHDQISGDDLVGGHPPGGADPDMVMGCPREVPGGGQPHHGALVPGEEITRYGSSASDAIRGSQSFVKKGLQLGSSVCLFVNGVPRPGWPLDAIPPEQIATGELYTKTGDETSTLAARWPHGAAFGSSAGTVATPTSPLSRRSLIHYAVIWLKQ